jgi:hypothetical protein
MRKTVILYVFAMLSFSGAFAQDDLDDLLKGSIGDANILLEGYVGPAMRILGSGLNQGWYNTAKPHQTLGVDLTITTSLMYVPSSDQFYFVDNNKLTDISLVNYDNQQIDPNTGSANVPTIFGPDKSPTYQLSDGSGSPINGPGGIDLKDAIKIADALPVPMYQLGLGLPKGFDLKVRFAPTVKMQDFQFNLFGVGVMHDVGQYIPAVKALPVDISAFVGYTKMKAEQDLSGTATGENQKGVLEFNSTTIQALVSKKISVLTIYGGVGYNIANSKLAMEGTYDLDDDGTAESTNPVNLDFSTSGFRATGGLRLKLAVFTLHADYTLSEYSALTAGFGINVR